MSECSICYGNISNKTGTTLSKCGHSFHNKCLGKWIKSCEIPTCPLCRDEIIPRTTRQTKDLYRCIVVSKINSINDMINETDDTDDNESDLIIFRKFSKLVIEHPILLINNPLLNDLLYHQSKIYPDSKELKKLCEDLNFKI